MIRQWKLEENKKYCKPIKVTQEIAFQAKYWRRVIFADMKSFSWRISYQTIDAICTVRCFVFGSS